jgi:hypothetical protein
MFCNYSEDTCAQVASLATHVPCQNEILQCRLHGIFMQGDYIVHFVLGEGDCVDMDGAIKIATSLNSWTGLMRIQTWSGTNIDTLYYKKFKGVNVFEWMAKEATHQDLMRFNSVK